MNDPQAVIDQAFDYCRQIGKGRRWHRDGSPVTVTAYELQEGNRFAQVGDVVGVEILPHDTVIRANGDRYVVRREVWQRIDSQQADTWKADNAGNLITGRI